MVYQHQMFTHRICCCSATAASQAMAILAIIVCAFAALTNWLYDQPIYLSIYQTILVVTEIAACILVFFAVCQLRPAFVLPIIVIQAWKSVSIIGTAIWSSIYLADDGYSAGAIAYNICIYVITLFLSLFILHCHVCCYKLLRFKMQ
ncbi:hypothetical protein PRIPAC_80338 [Pristionchus pacificus]|uniref:Uncharacterized protein n=1 Tax=Pristionchus pacificus TaxID=54126 RepID=A0A2A6CJ57_PRIPA|nr:hypothetical protein PRIPAC_80338 [Pristionchus pacificus]|eukprot:PDM78254.1 hypothetical protein PRIPAC_30833 [Pristionchus pacificus]